MFNLIVRITIGIKLQNTQSGLGEGICQEEYSNFMRVERYAFDVDLLVIAKDLKLHVEGTKLGILCVKA
jgi:hypothetical protein